jgi:hypothetical protein
MLPILSNIEILERFQSKALRMIVNEPWYVPNTLIRRDLQIPSVKEEITASVVWWSEFLATDPEARVRFAAIPEKKCSGSGTGSTQPREYKLRSYLIEK